MKELKISFHGFWPRFLEDEQNNVSFFKEIFSTVAENLIVQSNPDKSQILVSTYGCEQQLRDNAVNVLYISEPSNNKDGWDIVIAGLDQTKYPLLNIINVPLFISYLYCNNFLDKCYNKPKREEVPKKFCCWMVSNPNCNERNNIFFMLNQYKKVDSVGTQFNNTGFLLTAQYGSKEFFDFISQYKFVICAENSDMEQYITEKIFHGYLSNTIPIYWGTKYCKTIFNPNSFVYLEDTTYQSYMKVLEKVIQIDNNDELYLSMINSPVFIDNKLPNELEIETIKEKVKEKVYQVIENKKLNI